MSNLLISRVVEYNVSGTIPYFIYQYKQSLSPKIGPRLYLLRIIDNNLRISVPMFQICIRSRFEGHCR